MKKGILILMILTIAVILGAAFAGALVPPPPVNQSLGIYDTYFASFKESDCRTCHGSSLADRHHMLVQTKNKQCLDCHSLAYNPTTGAWELQAFRDCTICHKSSPHHTSANALARNCKACHGSFVDNYNDGHYIPTYAKSMVTPDTSGKPVIDQQTGNIITIGGCEACHVASTAVTPNIKGNNETHHGTGLGASDNSQCLWCHTGTGTGLDIRKCEECHGVKSLHNIQADSNNPGNLGTIVAGSENLGYGHIGNNWDCWGCHGWYDKYDVAPYSGATVPSISGLSTTKIRTGKSTVLTVNGSGFTNQIVDPVTGNILSTVSSSIVLDNGSQSITLQPSSITNNQIQVTVPASISVGTYSLQAVKSDKASNKTTLTVVPTVSINSAKITGTSLTVTGSGFGQNPTSSDYNTGLGVFVNNVSCKVTSWSDTKITCSGPVSKSGGIVTVKTLLGTASKRIK